MLEGLALFLSLIYCRKEPQLESKKLHIMMYSVSSVSCTFHLTEWLINWISYSIGVEKAGAKKSGNVQSLAEIFRDWNNCLIESYTLHINRPFDSSWQACYAWSCWLLTSFENHHTGPWMPFEVSSFSSPPHCCHWIYTRRNCPTVKKKRISENILRYKMTSNWLLGLIMLFLILGWFRVSQVILSNFNGLQ